MQIDPNDADAQEQLANALYCFNDKRVGHTTFANPAPNAVLDEAILHMRQAVALRPGDANFQSTLGTYLDNRGRDAEAIPYYKQALHLLGPTPVVNVLHRTSANGSEKAGEVFDNHWCLGDALLKTGQYREAAVHYQDALQFNPKADWVLDGLGDALNGSGRRAEARAVWKKEVALSPATVYYGRQARQRLAKYR